MKIGIIKETKIPEDNRVALTPKQVQLLEKQFPQVQLVVQSSEIRAIGDEEYKNAGIDVSEDLTDCDVLFGIKEADIYSLLPDKHYFFFGHIAKEQPYNQPLIKKMMDLNITFTDYEYLVDENNVRLCAFGWWAGVVGVYNTLRAYGLRFNSFELPKPDKTFTLEFLLSEARKHNYCPLKIIVTGNGRVSQGAQYVLDNIGIRKEAPANFLNPDVEESPSSYTVLGLPELVRPINKESSFNRQEFREDPSLYESNFMQYAKVANVFIPCHFWQPGNPVYLSKTDLKNKSMNIKIIGDVTCDIEGSIESTLRPATHDDPFYDYNPDTEQEEIAFSSDRNITVMAVDTLPNALAIDTSEYFGQTLIESVFPDVLGMDSLNSKVIERATILKKGQLTEKFEYLYNYASGN